jgi:hypothetical protein
MSEAMESGIITNDAFKTASSKGLFAGLRLTSPTLRETDGGFQAVPDSNVNLEQSSLRQIRWILVIEKEARTRGSAQSDRSADSSRPRSEAW